MILGIGTDIVQIARVEKIYAKYQQIFLQKILHEQEIEICQLLPAAKIGSYLAKRFAAKEAFAKAVGSGIGANIAFKEIAILNNAVGAPYLYLDPIVRNRFREQKFHLSLADDPPIAVAFVVVSQ